MKFNKRLFITSFLWKYKGRKTFGSIYVHRLNVIHMQSHTHTNTLINYIFPHSLISFVLRLRAHRSSKNWCLGTRHTSIWNICTYYLWFMRDAHHIHVDVLWGNPLSCIRWVYWPIGAIYIGLRDNFFSTLFKCYVVGSPIGHSTIISCDILTKEERKWHVFSISWYICMCFCV